MRSRRTRSEDGLRGFLTKLAASVLSALVVGAVGWNFATIISLQTQMTREQGQRRMIEYVLRYHGIELPGQARK